MDRKKELQMEYKLRKPEMGIIRVTNRENGLKYFTYAVDTQSIINRTKFQLEADLHPDKVLQLDWKKTGKDKFDFDIIERLPYSKDETKTDYVAALKAMLDKHIRENGGKGEIK